MGKILLPYAMATFVLQIWYNRFFDLQTYVSHLLHFSIQGPYYFLLFFIQLKLISPFLVIWCRFCNKQKASWLWHMVSVLFLCWFSSILIRYTFMLPVHGGGKNLFGGTYLLLYYIGILMANYRIFERLKAKRVIILSVSFVLWIIWWQLSCLGKLPFDTMLAAYWGDGFNPPSVNFIVFSIITLFICYSGFGLMEDSAIKINQNIVDATAFTGRYTLYIFMYHLMMRDVILTFLPMVQSNIWIMRFGIFIPMLLAPVLAVWLVRQIKKQIFKDCIES